jgi:hypothetical protein
MRTSVSFVLILLLLAAVGCSHQSEKISRAEANADFYLSQTDRTDPGEYSYVFDNLPESYDALCGIIKEQLIHPVEIGPYSDIIPEERHYEDAEYLTVGEMLAGLMAYDSTGLTLDREPQDRLVVACVHHALLFTSIVRQGGTPARMRFGFAPYIGRQYGVDMGVGHAICEVWDEGGSRWMYVDPDRGMVDFPKGDFECASESWQKLRQLDYDPDWYKSAFFKGEKSILDLLRLDLLYVLKEEPMYFDGPPVAPHDIPELDDLTTDELTALDRIADLMKNPGAHLDELRHLRESVDYLN